MRQPLDKIRISKPFGEKYPWTFFYIARALAGKTHKGIDYAAKCGTPVKAPTDMIQTYAGYKYGYGNVVYAKDGDYTYRFAHLKSIGIPRVGKKWKEGEVFAWIGNTGFSTGCHLHYEVREKGKLIDPTQTETSTLITRINYYFRKIFGRNPNRDENDYWARRVLGQKRPQITMASKLVNAMKYWKSKGLTKGNG